LDGLYVAADVLSVVLGAAATAYFGLALGCLARLRQGLASGAQATPPAMTILKPLCGDEPRLYECLRSFCAQDYPGLQIIFGMAETSGALAVAERLIAEFPARDIALVVEPARHGANRKVSNLINMLPAAKHEVLAISDSDTHLGDAGVLRRVAAFLEDRRLAAVTCPYAARPEPGLANALGTLQIEDRYLPETLVAARLGPVDFCLGPLTLVRRQAFDRIGGFDEIKEHLADDYRLGQLLAQHGFGVGLSPEVVETVVADALASLVGRELRWARTIRATQPLGHLASVVTHGPSILLLLALAAPSTATLAAAATAFAFRLALRFLVWRRWRSRERLRLWLVPFRDMLSFAIWIASFAGRGIEWRGRVYRIGEAGVLCPLASGAEPNAAVADAPVRDGVG
jgi:ceramide glucosyltransferase